MNKADLYREGARLPEQLSRLLFLDGMVEGRRVLEVGATSDAVARFLLELGASRVVCAVDDKALLESLRQTSTLDRVDFRAVRPTHGSRPPGFSSAPILPGDDGAFDLVIDFTLPQALGRGESTRLKDITRVLSTDGFALTALTTLNAPGLSTLLDPATKPGGPLTPGYRVIVDALKDEFELVQVYFQSLLLGYLFGSFDADTKDEGIAPQTLLMGDEPEPAGSYLFAFGNAVPVVDDVCLVQVPFDALLAAVGSRRGARNFADHTEAHSPRALPLLADSGSNVVEGGSSLDPTTAPLIAEVLRLQGALAEREAALLMMTAAAHTLQDPSRTLSPIEADATEIAEGGRAGVVGVLALSLDHTTARLQVSEEQLVLVREDLSQILKVRDALRGDRDALAEQNVRYAQDSEEQKRRLRSAVDESHQLQQRNNELEGSAADAAARTAFLEAQLIEVHTRSEGERQRQGLERVMLDATLVAHAEQVDELEAALAGALNHSKNSGQVLPLSAETIAKAQSQEETQLTSKPSADVAADVSADVSADVDTDVAADVAAARSVPTVSGGEGLVAALQARVVSLEAALVGAEESARNGRGSIAEVLDAADDVQRRLQADIDSACARAAAAEARAALLEEDRARMQQRVHSLEGDAQRLAEGVKVLVAERSQVSTRLVTAAQDVAHDAERDLALARAEALARDASAALDEARVLAESQSIAAAAEADKVSERRRVDQAALSELRARLQEARGGIDDVTAQRTVLQQALAAREAQLHERRNDQAQLQQQVERAAAALSEQQKRCADADVAAGALSVEVRRLNGVVEDTALTTRTLISERDEARALAEELSFKRRAAEDEALAALELVESERGRLQQAAVDDTAALRAAFELERQALTSSFSEEHAAIVEQLQVTEKSVRAAAVREAIDSTVAQADGLYQRQLTEAQAHHADVLQQLEAGFAAEQAARRAEAKASVDVAAAALAGERATARDELTRLSAEHEATRDELAVNTEALLVLEERVADERSTIERVHAAEIERGQRNADDLSARLDEARAVQVEIRAEMQSVVELNVELEARLAASAAAVSAAATALHLAENAAAELNAQRQIAEEQGARLAETLDGSVLEVGVLRVKLADAHVSIEELTQRIADHHAAQQQTDAEIADLQTSLAQGSADAAAALERYVAATAANTRLQAQVVELETLVESASAEIADLQTQATQAGVEADAVAQGLRVINASLESLTLALAEETARRSHAEVEGKALQSRLAVATTDVDDLDLRLNATVAAVAALTERAAGSEATVAVLRQEVQGSANRAEMAEDQVEVLTSKLNFAELALSELREEISEAQRAIEDVGRRAGDEAIALQAQLDEQSVELESSQTRLSERERALEDLRPRLTDALQLVSDFEAERVRLDRMAVVAEQTQQQELAAASTVADELRATMVALGQEIAQLCSERDGLVAALAAATAAKDSTHKKVDDLVAEIAHTRESYVAKLTSGQAILDALRLELAASRDQSQAWKAHLDEADAGLQDVRSSLQRVTTERELLDGALLEARSLLGVERARGDLFHEELLEAGETLVRERARGDLFGAELEEAQLAVGQIRRQLLDLRAHGQEVQETLDNLSAGAEEDAVRGDLFAAQLQEAQQTLERECQRTVLLRAQLDEAQQAAARAVTRAAELAGTLDDAQQTFRERRLANQQDLQRLLGAQEAEQVSRNAQHRHDLDRLDATLDDERVARARSESSHAEAAAAVIAVTGRLQSAELEQGALAQRLAEMETATAAAAKVRRSEMEDLGSLRARVESLHAESTGLRESLEMAREDAQESLGLENQANEALALVTAERDALQNSLTAASAVQDGADAQRDAAIAEAAAAVENARLEASRRELVEQELQRRRTEHELAVQKSLSDSASRSVNSLEDVAAMKERVDTAEKASKAKDQKIGEQAERINRLTERIVRIEGLG